MVRAAAEGPDLSVTVNGLKLPNPFVIGSGPPGTNYTVMKRAFDEGWGGVIAKTVCILFVFFILAAPHHPKPAFLHFNLESHCFRYL
jgi:dihydropyrimidine dehydrogenase (NADP+)